MPNFWPSDPKTPLQVYHLDPNTSVFGSLELERALGSDPNSLHMYDPGAAAPHPPMVPPPIQSGCVDNYGFIPPCRVAVVVVMLSSPSVAWLWWW